MTEEASAPAAKATKGAGDPRSYKRICSFFLLAVLALVKISHIIDYVTYSPTALPFAQTFCHTKSAMSDRLSKKPGLAAAAEALVEASDLEVDSVTQKRLAENLDALKTSFDANMNEVVQTVKSSSENFDAKVNTLIQHVATVKGEISAVKSLLEAERRDKRLERATTMTHINSFDYYEEGDIRRNSSDLAKGVIERFLLGDFGIFLPDATLEEMDSWDGHGQEEREASNKEFREKFTEQIKELTAVQPRLEKQPDGRYVIWHS